VFLENEVLDLTVELIRINILLWFQIWEL
jgi:hypothetical protein